MASVDIEVSISVRMDYKSHCCVAEIFFEEEKPVCSKCRLRCELHCSPRAIAGLFAKGLADFDFPLDI